MSTVLFGNPSPMMTEEIHSVDEDGNTVKKTVTYPAKHISQSVTRVELWPGVVEEEFVKLTLGTDNDRLLTLIARNLPEEQKIYAVALRELEDVVGVHSNGVKPTWVSSDDPLLQGALANHFQCLAGEPQALQPNAGRDALHSQNLATSAQPAAFNYGALTANTGTGFAVADTTLAGEITTAGGGLIRGQMTFAHTAGTNTSTLTKTWTANGSDSLPVTIASWGVFNASAAGTLGYEDPLNSTATLNVSGDSVTVTFTLTAG